MRLVIAAEPYVAAADVSTAVGREGQAGWTWYTGSAGVMYRAWIEDVLGFKLRGDLLTLSPALPEDWPGFDITYRYRSSVYEITVQERSLNRSDDDVSRWRGAGNSGYASTAAATAELIASTYGFPVRCSRLGPQGARPGSAPEIEPTRRLVLGQR